MRNPLTSALAAMALCALGTLAFGWGFPSFATFLAAILAIAWATFDPPAPPKSIGGVAAISLLLPTVVPASVLVAIVAASAVILLPAAPDPIGDFAIALPSLSLLVLLLTL